MENFDQLALTWDNDPGRIERANAVAAQIRAKVPDLDQKTGFEYGCGTGVLSVTLQPYLKQITLADSSEGMLAVLQEKITKLQLSNMQSLKLDLAVEKAPEMKTDLVYTLLAMHHVRDIDVVIKAFYDILNPQGYLCIADLIEEDGSFHGSDFTGHQGFNQTALASKLAGFGFKNVSSEICFEVVKKTETGTEKRYPVFLMMGRKG
jgi:ubiquinone/menaquinone biosynthesis C-methylase UbiE